LFCRWYRPCRTVHILSRLTAGSTLRGAEGEPLLLEISQRRAAASAHCFGARLVVLSAVGAGSSTVVAKASKPKAAKKAQSHPSYFGMICRAVSELKEKSGSSKAAILKFTLSHYKLSDNETKAALKGELEQVKESGASGSFSIGEKKSVRAAEKVREKEPEDEDSSLCIPNFPEGLMHIAVFFYALQQIYIYIALEFVVSLSGQASSGCIAGLE
uniref:H15 domain-containing protein n=1 Tax=Angiostrongylus cantonensis TaxID=6313 RepID=A0A0K0D8E1_ANGCA